MLVFISLILNEFEHLFYVYESFLYFLYGLFIYFSFFPGFLSFVLEILLFIY